MILSRTLAFLFPALAALSFARVGAYAESSERQASAGSSAFAEPSVQQAFDEGMTEVQDSLILSFEDGTQPLVAGRGSRLALSGEHFKHGNKSVEWRWNRNGASADIFSPIGYIGENPDPKETSVSTFVFWIYSPKSLTDSRLHFEFKKEGRTCCHFDYNLGFSGWRGAWVAFDRDMQGKPERAMDQLTITVDGANKGQVFFDHIILSSFQDVRYHTADFQAPFINPHTTSHWLTLLKSWQNPMPEAAESLSASEKEDMSTIEGRLRELLLEGRKPSSMESLRTAFDSYGIHENRDRSVTGKPIWFVRYAETYINMGHPSVATLYRENGQLLRVYNDLMYRIAVTWSLGEPSKRPELERMYLLMTRHLLDQGFAAGSAQGTLHHLGYSMRNFYTAPVLMRQVLARAGLDRQVQQAMDWFSGAGETRIAPTQRGMDIDAFNTSLMGRLSSIIMMQDGPQKAACLRSFSRWVDNGFKTTEGTVACFKSDGTIFHHQRHYPAYAVDGLTGGAVNAIWLLSRTGFAISEESHFIARKALLEMRFWCNQKSFPLALSGRHPDGKGALAPWIYARLAEAGSVGIQDSTRDNTDIDRDLAAAYLRMAPESDKWTKKFETAGIRAEDSPTGTRVYGWNSFLSHRRGDWLVTVAGHSRYLCAAESYQHANLYGRYLTYGSVEVIGSGNPVNIKDSGFRQEGWDWCHIPGTTALEIPMEKMRADIINPDTFSGYEEMLLSDESFAGGVSHKGRNGVFGMILHGHDKYNGSLRARKSVFLFDNRIVALGSGIENKAEGGVHTTLFQCSMEDASAGRILGNIDSKEVNINNSEASIESNTTYLKNIHYGGRTVITDNKGNLFVVSNGRVHAEEGLQYSLDQETDTLTSGVFTKAWIDHGQNEVSGGAYEYLELIGSVSEKQAYKNGAKLPYKVLRHDNSAHIVRDSITGITGYCLFEAGKTGVDCIESVNLPSVIMTSKSCDENRLTISVADPDLRLYEGPADDIYGPDGKTVERSVYSRKWLANDSGRSKLQVVLKGRWTVENAGEAWPSAGASGQADTMIRKEDSIAVSEDGNRACTASCEGQNTILTFICHEGATIEATLKPLKSTGK